MRTRLPIYVLLLSCTAVSALFRIVGQEIPLPALALLIFFMAAGLFYLIAVNVIEIRSKR